MSPKKTSKHHDATTTTSKKRSHRTAPRSASTTVTAVGTTDVSAVTHDTSHTEPKENAMSTAKNDSSHAAASSTATPVAIAATPAALTSAEATKPLPLVFLNPPPANAFIPPAPAGFVLPEGGENIGLRPRATELTVLPLAISELSRFPDYAEVMGTAAPPIAYVQQALSVGLQWTTMRAATSEWDDYCNHEEGIAWSSIGLLLERLRISFQAAATADPTLPARFPNLAALLGAKKVIAKKGATTRRANRQSQGKGEAALHGASGKKKKRELEKQALAQQTAAPVVPPAPPAPAATPEVPAASATTTVTGGASH